MNESRPAGLAGRWTAIAVLAAAYFFAHFHRISPAVLAYDLRHDFGIDAIALGWLSSMYFYLYGAMQIPVGILTDRYGARRVVTGFTLLSFAGAVLFGLAPNFAFAAVARTLVGAGVAGVYVPALKSFSGWAGPQEFATVTGIMIAVGNLGALAATTPLALLAGWVGWRLTFLAIGGLSLGLALLCWWVVRDPERPGQAPAGCTAVGSQAESRFEWGVLRDREVLLLGLAQLGKYGPLMAFLGAWGSLYLTEAYGLSRVAAGNYLMLISLGYAVGSPLFGHFSDRVLRRRRPPLLLGTLVFLILWLPFVLGWRLPPALLGAALLLMGITAGGTGTVVFSMGKETVQPHVSGTAMAAINALTFLAVTIFQPLTGYAIGGAARLGATDAFARYHLAFLICFAGVVFGAAAAWLTRETAAGEQATGAVAGFIEG